MQEVYMDGYFSKVGVKWGFLNDLHALYQGRPKVVQNGILREELPTVHFYFFANSRYDLKPLL
jgi:hypothetical protein